MIQGNPDYNLLLEQATGAHIASVSPVLNAEIDKMMAQVHNKVFTAISKNELTPELAMQAWHELNSYFRLRQRFNQQIKVGQAAGEALHKGEN